jgi:RecA-family ATPase
MSREGMSMTELLRQPVEPVEWIVEDLIPFGLTMLTAAPKAGKSLLCLDIGWQVANGGEVLGRQVERGEVVYIALEDNAGSLTERAVLMHGDKVTCDGLTPFFEWSEMGSTVVNAVSELRDYLTTHNGVRLVIVDTWGAFQAARSGTSISFNKDYKEVRQLRQVAEDYHLGVLVTHHVRKPKAGGKAGDPMDDISGTAALRAAADTLLMLQHDKVSKQATLLVEGRRIKDQKLFLRLSENLVWQLADAPERRTESAAVIRYLEEHGPTHYKAIAQALSTSEGTMKTRLSRLLDSGEVVAEGQGVYKVPAVERDADAA